ncbi:urea carboxylase-associated family protein [Pigmentiphaga soli]|uniref:Urea carboxylase-associated family protein n=1 Tax=Pigmentiphaga soli TaxID=1007095 RepID=A0ABP8GQ85_9BURK
MKPAQQGLIPARHGSMALVDAGQSIRVINTHGQQVVDTWALCRGDPAEYLSMEHTRAGLSRLRPRVGDVLLTNRRRPILAITADTSPGVHDTLIAACDIYRYHGLGCTGYHRNCTDNFNEQLKQLGVPPRQPPCPLNLFMNIPWKADGSLEFAAPPCRPGDYIELRALMDCVMVFSACPQDMLPINGAECTPTDAHYSVMGA